MSQKNLVWLLKGGVFLTFFCIFFVFKNLLFPFITSKQIPFNVLVEILTFFWVYLIIKYPAWRPKKSYITWGLVAFFAIALLSGIIGVDWNLSFWGDIERMLGWFHVIHFFLFYLIIITVFRTRADWYALFAWSVAIACLESLSVLTGERRYGTIGNTAYVSGYLIFNLFFAVQLFFWEKNWWVRWIYPLTLPLMLAAFKTANTSGAYVGLAAGIFVSLGLWGFLASNKKTKQISLAVLAVLALLTVFAFTHKENPVLKKMPTVYKVVKGISFKKNTFQTRLISWQAAWYDWRDTPSHILTGTGFGNFAITFDKYFNPKFYLFTSSETYFDRAHNNLIEIASTTGLPGLLAYLSIFAAAFWYLYLAYRRQRVSLADFALISGLIVAYFVQNLAVFDSFVTYLSLMVLLGYIYFLASPRQELAYAEAGPLATKQFLAVLGCGLFVLFSVYNYNYLPYKMLDYTIQGQVYLSQGQIDKAIEAYKQALSFHTGLDRDSRTSLIRYFVSRPSVLSKLPADKAKNIVDYLIELGKKNVQYNPRDSLNLMLLAQTYNLAASLNRNNPEKFSYYSKLAEETIDRSIAATPGRVPVYFSKAQIYLTRGETDKAIEIMKYATSLEDDFYSGHCQLARMYWLLSQRNEKYKNLKPEGIKEASRCLETGGVGQLDDNLRKEFLQYYWDHQDYQQALKIAEYQARHNKKNADLWVNLAKIYEKLGDFDQARQAAEKAVEANPAYQAAAQKFIANLGQSQAKPEKTKSEK